MSAKNLLENIDVASLLILLLLASSDFIWCQSEEQVVECYFNTNCSTEMSAPLLMTGRNCCIVSHAVSFKNDSRICRMCIEMILFAYGGSVGDEFVPTADDGSSAPITLQEDVIIFGVKEDTLFVNTNGILSFREPYIRPLPLRFDSSILPAVPLVAPFWADVDITRFGNISFRQSMDSTLLQNAADLLHDLQFPSSGSDFLPNIAFVATWDSVAEYIGTPLMTAEENTFQVVIAADNNKTIALFIYGAIKWGESSSIGFKSEDGSRHLTVPPSRTAATVDIEHTSNVGVPGLYVYRIDGNECPSSERDSVSCPFNQSQCIPVQQLCDGSEDCYDSSDESQLFCPCPAGSGRCFRSQEGCVPVSSYCDGRGDCPDGSDESTNICNACPIGQVSCERDANSFCFSISTLCNSSQLNCSGHFAETPDFCSALHCEELPMPDNGLVAVSLSSSGFTATYNCNDGYSLDGEGTRFCQSNGSWSGSVPTCVDTEGDVVCRPLVPPANGEVFLPMSRTPGSNASYNCNVAFSLTGDQNRTCGTNGEWSGREPTCEVHDGIAAVAGVVGGLLLVSILLNLTLVVVCWKKDCGPFTRRSNTSGPGDLNATYYQHETSAEQLGRFRVKSFNRVQAEIPDDLMIYSSGLKILETIGQGEFGVVYKGYLMKDIGQTIVGVVAVKTLKGFLNDTLVKSLLEECLKMQQFDHPNVLKLIGVCLDGGPTPYLVMPFMGNGSLLVYLHKERANLIVCADDQDVEETKYIVLKRLMDMCLQVAKGMEYLTGMKFVHRDLAARNCMIDDNYVIQVADFGLAEQLDTKDYFRQDETAAVKLPVKWLAPESLTDYIFSEKSDVWAYGVTCWEVFSGGKVPYAGVNPHDLASLLERGYRMEKPANAACSEQMYSIMTHCWKADPSQRPTFSDLTQTISNYLESMAGYLHVQAFNQPPVVVCHAEDGTVMSTETWPSSSNTNVADDGHL